MSENILIIEKNTIELRKLREMLTREGYSVMTATDSETAKQICKQIPIKFILGDIEELGCGKESKTSKKI
jgi:PleD family two-component response regulator